MKRHLYGFAMAQSMYCAVPCPWKVWDEEARPLMPFFLPLIGLEIGGIWFALAWTLERLRLSPLLTGLLLCAYPYLITGFFHLDGFMDVVDAVRSCRGAERRREILKDPHAGSFAVAGCALLLLAQFALFSSGKGDIRLLILIPAVSRCCSALAVSCFKPIITSQYAGKRLKRPYVALLAAELVLMTAAGFWVCGRGGWALAGCVLGYALALERGRRSLGGVSGDIAGYALTIGELCAVAVYALM